MPNAHLHDQYVGRVNAILEEECSHDIFLSRGIIEEESDPEEDLDYLDDFDLEIDE